MLMKHFKQPMYTHPSKKHSIFRTIKDFHFVFFLFFVLIILTDLLLQLMSLQEELLPKQVIEYDFGHLHI